MNEMPRAGLDNRVALITGGAGHLGSAIADELARLGASVAVADLDAGRVAEVTRGLRHRHGLPTADIAVDLADGEAVRAIPERVVSQLGGLHIIVNCAAMVGTSNDGGWAVPFADQSLAAWQRCLAINLTAPFLLIQAATPYLMEAPGGAVINIASIYGVAGPDWRLYEGTALGNPAAYAASKGGLIQLTRWLATTLAPHVRVNCVSPGGIERGQGDEFVERYVARTPMQRMASEADVVGAVAFLATPASSYITGQNIMVDGGWTAW